jgi:hypothetical protein
MPTPSEDADERWARTPKQQAKHEAAERAKRPKYGGRKKGAINKRTLNKIVEEERKLAAAQREVVGKRPHSNDKLAIDHMDEMIDYFRGLIGVHQPWNADGTPRPGKDDKLWFRCVEVFQGFLNMRAPYQSARLGAMALIPAQTRQKTVVNVTILNEKGDTVYSDAPMEDVKTIEHDADETPT